MVIPRKVREPDALHAELPRGYRRPYGGRLAGPQGWSPQ